MANDSADADHSEHGDGAAGSTSRTPPATPDYPLEETLGLDRPEQYRALFEETRQQIVSLLLERAATTSELAEALGKPKGTVGHHLKVLEEAGLVHVVRTKRVRALEAKYYGRTARLFLFYRVDEGAQEPQRSIAVAAEEVGSIPGESDLPMISTVRYARIPQSRAEEWRQRISDMIDEFATQPRGGDTTYGFVVGVYPTERRGLPEPDDDA